MRDAVHFDPSIPDRQVTGESSASALTCSGSSNTDYRDVNSLSSESSYLALPTLKYAKKLIPLGRRTGCANSGGCRCEEESVLQNMCNKRSERLNKPCKNGFCYCYTSDSDDIRKASTSAKNPGGPGLEHHRCKPLRKQYMYNLPTESDSSAIVSSDQYLAEKAKAAQDKKKKYVNLPPESVEGQCRAGNRDCGQKCGKDKCRRRPFQATNKFQEFHCSDSDAPLIHIIQEVQRNMVVSEIRINRSKLKGKPRKGRSGGVVGSSEGGGGGNIVNDTGNVGASNDVCEVENGGEELSTKINGKNYQINAKNKNINNLSKINLKGDNFLSKGYDDDGAKSDLNKAKQKSGGSKGGRLLLKRVGPDAIYQPSSGPPRKPPRNFSSSSDCSSIFSEKIRSSSKHSKRKSLPSANSGTSGGEQPTMLANFLLKQATPDPVKQATSEPVKQATSEAVIEKNMKNASNSSLHKIWKTKRDEMESSQEKLNGKDASNGSLNSVSSVPSSKGGFSKPTLETLNVEDGPMNIDPNSREEFAPSCPTYSQIASPNCSNVNELFITNIPNVPNQEPINELNSIEPRKSLTNIEFAKINFTATSDVPNSEAIGWVPSNIYNMLNTETAQMKFVSQQPLAEPQQEQIGWQPPAKLQIDTVDGKRKGRENEDFHNFAVNMACKSTPVKPDIPKDEVTPKNLLKEKVKNLPSPATPVRKNVSTKMTAVMECSRSDDETPVHQDDVQHDSAPPDYVQPDYPQPDCVQSEEVQAGTYQAEDVQPDDEQAEDVRTENVQPVQSEQKSFQKRALRHTKSFLENSKHKILGFTKRKEDRKRSPNKEPKYSPKTVGTQTSDSVVLQGRRLNFEYASDDTLNRRSITPLAGEKLPEVSKPNHHSDDGFDFSRKVNSPKIDRSSQRKQHNFSPRQFLKNLQVNTEKGTAPEQSYKSYASDFNEDFTVAVQDLLGKARAQLEGEQPASKIVQDTCTDESVQDYMVATEADIHQEPIYAEIQEHHGRNDVEIQSPITTDVSHEVVANNPSVVYARILKKPKATQQTTPHRPAPQPPVQKYRLEPSAPEFPVEQPTGLPWLSHPPAAQQLTKLQNSETITEQIPHAQYTPTQYQTNEHQGLQQQVIQPEATQYKAVQPQVIQHEALHLQSIEPQVAQQAIQHQVSKPQVTKRQAKQRQEVQHQAIPNQSTEQQALQQKVSQPQALKTKTIQRPRKSPPPAPQGLLAVSQGLISGPQGPHSVPESQSSAQQAQHSAPGDSYVPSLELQHPSSMPQHPFSAVQGAPSGLHGSSSVSQGLPSKSHGSPSKSHGSPPASQASSSESEGSRGQNSPPASQQPSVPQCWTPEQQGSPSGSKRLSPQPEGSPSRFQSTSATKNPSELQSWSPQPQSWSPQPQSWSPEPQSWSPQPQNWSPEPRGSQSGSKGSSPKSEGSSSRRHGFSPVPEYPRGSQSGSHGSPSDSQVSSPEPQGLPSRQGFSPELEGLQPRRQQGSSAAQYPSNSSKSGSNGSPSASHSSPSGSQDSSPEPGSSSALQYPSVPQDSPSWSQGSSPEPALHNLPVSQVWASEPHRSSTISQATFLAPQVWKTEHPASSSAQQGPFSAPQNPSDPQGWPSEPQNLASGSRGSSPESEDSLSRQRDFPSAPSGLHGSSSAAVPQGLSTEPQASSSKSQGPIAALQKRSVSHDQTSKPHISSSAPHGPFSAAPQISKLHDLPSRAHPLSSASQATYSAPQGAYSAQQVAYSAPKGAYTAQQGAYSAQQVTYSAPKGAYSAPQGAYSAPQGAYSAQQAAYSAPQGAYSAEQGAYSAPQSVPSITVDPTPLAGQEQQQPVGQYQAARCLPLSSTPEPPTVQPSTSFNNSREKNSPPKVRALSKSDLSQSSEIFLENLFQTKNSNVSPKSSNASPRSSNGSPRSDDEKRSNLDGAIAVSQFYYFDDQHHGHSSNSSFSSDADSRKPSSDDVEYEEPCGDEMQPGAISPSIGYGAIDYDDRSPQTGSYESCQSYQDKDENMNISATKDLSVATSKTNNTYQNLKFKIRASFRKGKNYLKKETKRLSVALDRSFSKSENAIHSNKRKSGRGRKGEQSDFEVDYISALELLNETTKDASVKRQLEQTVSLCRQLPEFETSSAMVEAERLLLYSTLKENSFYKSDDSIPSHHSPPKDFCSGTVCITSFEIPIKPDIHYDAYFNYFYIGVFTHDRDIRSTQTAEKVDNAVFFSNCNMIFDVLTANFEINVDLYVLRLRKLSAPSTQKENGPIKIRRSSLSDSREEIVSRFRMHGNFIIRAENLEPYEVKSNSNNISRNTEFSLVANNLCSIPISLFSRNINLMNESWLTANIAYNFKNFELNGFLNVGDIHRKHDWNKRWCQIDALTLYFWNYPQECLTITPILTIDLVKCVSYPIKSANREICPKPRSFQLEINTDEMIDEVYATDTFLFSTENQEDYNYWVNGLNDAVEFIRTWKVQVQ